MINHTDPELDVFGSILFLLKKNLKKRFAPLQKIKQNKKNHMVALAWLKPGNI